MTVLLEVSTQAQLDKLRQEYRVLGILQPDDAHAARQAAQLQLAELYGALSHEEAERMQREVQESRNEWERNF